MKSTLILLVIICCICLSIPSLGEQQKRGSVLTQKGNWIIVESKPIPEGYQAWRDEPVRCWLLSDTEISSNADGSVSWNVWDPKKKKMTRFTTPVATNLGVVRVEFNNVEAYDAAAKIYNVERDKCRAGTYPALAPAKQ